MMDPELQRALAYSGIGGVAIMCMIALTHYVILPILKVRPAPVMFTRVNGHTAATQPNPLANPVINGKPHIPRAGEESTDSWKLYFKERDEALLRGIKAANQETIVPVLQQILDELKQLNSPNGRGKAAHV